MSHHNIPQLGSWLYHTRLWHLRIWPFPSAKLVMTSPRVYEKTSCVGSMAYHFCVLPGVICPKFAVLFRIATYWVSVNSPLSVAEPKYFSPFALASVFNCPRTVGTKVAAGKRRDRSMVTNCTCTKSRRDAKMGKAYFLG